MTLILDLPQDIDEQLQRDADRQGVAKESLAIDLIARSLADAGGNSQPIDGVHGANDFWAPIDVEALAKEQGVKPVTDFDEWLRSMPKIEGVDELVEQIEASRKERREAERQHG